MQSTDVTCRNSKFTMDRSRCSTASAASARIAQRTQSVSFVTSTLVASILRMVKKNTDNYLYKLLNSVSTHLMRTLHISAAPLSPWRQMAINASFHSRVCHSMYSKPHIVAQRPYICGQTAYVSYVVG